MGRKFSNKIFMLYLQTITGNFFFDKYVGVVFFFSLRITARLYQVKNEISVVITFCFGRRDKKSKLW